MGYSLRRLTETAVLLAIGMVLSMLQINNFWALGGSITLCSMLPVVMLAQRYGTRWGLLAAFAFSLLQMLLGMNNLQYAPNAVTLVAIILLDYVLAFGVLGFSAVLNNVVKNRRWAIVAGIALTFSARFLCHFVSGIIVWEALWPNGLGWSPWVWSLAYNASYMVPEAILTSVAAFLLYKPLKRFWLGEDLKRPLRGGASAPGSDTP